MEENEIEINLSDYLPYIDNITSTEKRIIRSIIPNYDFTYGDLIKINTTSEELFTLLVYLLRTGYKSSTFERKVVNRLRS